MIQQLWKYDFDIDDGSGTIVKCHAVVREYSKNDNSYIEIDYSLSNVESLSKSTRAKIKNNLIMNTTETVIRQLTNV